MFRILTLLSWSYFIHPLFSFSKPKNYLNKEVNFPSLKKFCLNNQYLSSLRWFWGEKSFFYEDNLLAFSSVFILVITIVMDTGKQKNAHFFSWYKTCAPENFDVRILGIGLLSSEVDIIIGEDTRKSGMVQDYDWFILGNDIFFKKIGKPKRKHWKTHLSKNIDYNYGMWINIMMGNGVCLCR